MLLIQSFFPPVVWCVWREMGRSNSPTLKKEKKDLLVEQNYEAHILVTYKRLTRGDSGT